MLKRVQKQMVSSGSSNQSRAQSHFFPHLVVVPLFFSHLFEEIASFATRRRPMDVDESARQKHFIIVFLTWNMFLQRYLLRWTKCRNGSTRVPKYKPRYEPQSALNVVWILRQSFFFWFCMVFERSETVVREANSLYFKQSEFNFCEKTRENEGRQFFVVWRAISQSLDFAM